MGLVVQSVESSVDVAAHQLICIKHRAVNTAAACQTSFVREDKYVPPIKRAWHSSKPSLTQIQAKSDTDPSQV